MIINNVFSQTLPIMLALCLMLLATYYAQNYAGIIGWSLVTALIEYIDYFIRVYYLFPDIKDIYYKCQEL